MRTFFLARQRETIWFPIVEPFCRNRES